MSYSCSLFYISVILKLISFQSVACISCYQCNSTDHEDPFQCTEFLSDSVNLVPKECNTVYNAAFCIKQIGRFEACSIQCYICDSRIDIKCTDLLIRDDDESISNLHACDSNSLYCIKTTGYYAGGLGTKRFCSSLDLGNYCNYVEQPGDPLEYRSCVYTCDSDGCNGANNNYPHFVVPLTTIFCSLVIWYTIT